MDLVALTEFMLKRILKTVSLNLLTTRILIPHYLNFVTIFEREIIGYVQIRVVRIRAKCHLTDKHKEFWSIKALMDATLENRRRIQDANIQSSRRSS